MKERLEAIKQETIAKIKNAEDLNILNDIRVEILGKKGQLTEVLKGMKDVAPEDRPKVGQMVNDTRKAIEEKMEEVKAQLQEKAREAKLKAEVIDVTLPAKKNKIGHKHPNTLALEELQRIFVGMGYEVVEGVKRSRGKESAIHRACAGLFYKMMSKAVKIDMSRASDFKLLDRKAVDALLGMPEKNAFFRALSSWIGYRSTSVEFDVQERTEGESKWSTWSLIKYAVTNVVAFSTAPMQFVTVAGIFTFLFAIVLGIESLVRYFTGHAVEGFTTVILLILIVGSLIMMSLGIIGYYISKIYEEVKGRPKYLISKKAGKRK